MEKMEGYTHKEKQVLLAFTQYVEKYSKYAWRQVQKKNDPWRLSEAAMYCLDLVQAAQWACEKLEIKEPAPNYFEQISNKAQKAVVK